MLHLLKKIIFFPYAYLDSFEEVNEGLATKYIFHTRLTDHSISAKNYEHVLNVWEAFIMNTKNIIVIYTWTLMFYYWLICLKPLQKNP